MQEQAKPNVPEKRVFRLIVSNASEAVSIIQKKFGTGATVQSVKQHQPKGVTKLWSNPKLEIIVSVPTRASGEIAFQLPNSGSESIKNVQEKQTGKNTESVEEKVSGESAMPDIEEVTKSSKTEEQNREPDRKKETGSETVLSTLTVEDILEQSDFDKTLIQRLKNHPQWNTINQRSAKQGLIELVAIFREEFIAAQTKKMGPFTAFIGTPGVGKSTILRKTIANRVFVHGKNVQVLKLDDDDPNPDDLLTVFCEVTGVKLMRDPKDLNIEKGTEVYVDIPGITSNEPEKIRHIKSALDELEIRTRVLVMNSLYDTASLNSCYELGRHLGATHQTFTHLDELEHWAKLWRFVLRGSYPLIFLNMGDESSAAPKDEFLPLLISKTFPKILQN